MKACDQGIKLIVLWIGTLLVSLGLSPSDGFSQASFFQGKTLPSSKAGTQAAQAICG